MASDERGGKKGSPAGRSIKNQPKIRSNHPLTRLQALKRLKGLVDVCTFRLEYPSTPNKQRLAWARVLSRTLAASGPLLRDADLDELMARLDKVEAALKRRG